MKIRFIIHPGLGKLVKSILHTLAMHSPNIYLKRFLYRSRGTKLGKNVLIADNVFMGGCAKGGFERDIFQ